MKPLSLAIAVSSTLFIFAAGIARDLLGLHGTPTDDTTALPDTGDLALRPIGEGQLSATSLGGLPVLRNRSK